MNKVLVSIVIPTYNKAQLTIETLKSIMAQTYANWECIIVDDGSNNEAFKNIEAFTSKDARFKLYKRPANKPKGANACRNYGITLSEGEYLQLFDSDDLMLPNCIKGRVEAITNTQYDFVVFAMDIFDGETVYANSDQDPVEHWDAALDEFLSERRLPWNLQRVFFKFQSVKNKIDFNEALLRFQDGDFNVRMLATLKPSFKMFNVVDCYYRMPSTLNPRSSNFYINVYKSLPGYINSINNALSKSQKKKYTWYFRNWIFAVVGLYTQKDIDKTYFKNAVKAIEEQVGLSFFKKILLHLLFVSKKHFKGKKGSTFINKLLNKWYGAKTKSNYELNENII